MKQYLFILPCFFLVGLFSCTTVKVTKITDANRSTAEGSRYALGKPVLKVTPNPAGDGTYTTELIYVPDESQIYAVSAKSFLTKFSMQLDIDEAGILKKVEWAKTGNAPVTEGITAAGDILKADIERRNKESADKEKELKADIKANNDALEKVNDALAQKKADKKIAEAELASLQAIAPTSDAIKEKIRIAEINIKKLTEDINILEEKKRKLETKADSLSSAANEAAIATAFGSVFFDIVESSDGKTLELKAIEWPEKTKQVEYKLEIPGAGGSGPGAGSGVNNGPKTAESLKVKYEADGKAVISIEFDKEIASAGFTQSNIAGNGITLNIGKLNPTISGKKIEIPVTEKDLPKSDKYTIVLLKVKSKTDKDTDRGTDININLTME